MRGCHASVTKKARPYDRRHFFRGLPRGSAARLFGASRLVESRHSELDKGVVICAATRRNAPISPPATVASNRVLQTSACRTSPHKRIQTEYNGVTNSPFPPFSSVSLGVRRTCLSAGCRTVKPRSNARNHARAAVAAAATDADFSANCLTMHGSRRIFIICKEIRKQNAFNGHGGSFWIRST